jgi:hypothetical protein
MDIGQVCEMHRQTPPDAWLEAGNATSDGNELTPSENVDSSTVLLPQPACHEETGNEQQFGRIERRSRLGGSGRLSMKKAHFKTASVQQSPRGAYLRSQTMPAASYAASTVSSDAKIVPRVPLPKHNMLFLSHFPSVSLFLYNSLLSTAKAALAWVSEFLMLQLDQNHMPVH